MQQTLVQEIRTNATTLKQQVCEMLNITEEDYAQRQYMQGLSYLHWYLPNHANCRKILEADKLYWNWWKLMWKARDEVFVDNLSQWTEKDMDIVERIWHELHAAWNVIGDTKPPKEVTKILFKKKEGIV